MAKFSQGIIKYRKIILITFIVFALISAFLALEVTVNYDLKDYLPDGTQSTDAIKIMSEEFSDNMPNAKIMLKDVSIGEVIEYKEKIKEIDGVKVVTWLDDIIDIRILETMPAELLGNPIIDSSMAGSFASGSPMDYPSIEYSAMEDPSLIGAGAYVANASESGASTTGTSAAEASAAGASAAGASMAGTSMIDASMIESYYKDNNALISLTIEDGKESAAVNAIYNLIGENNAVTGEAVNIAESQSMAVTEVLNALLILLPIIVIILVLSTTSWFEPLLFLLTIGIAVIINMGTNIIFGEISFITRTVSPILQLAVSLDYAIFLLHSFNEYRLSHEPHEAMLLAMKQSLPTVAASAATTVIGFSALAFMRFGIGADLGLNLVKGIILSFISVMVFLPALALMCYKAIEKTKHRRLMPSFKSVGNWVMKVRLPFLILALALVVPCFLAQSKTQFMYGMSSVTEESRVGKDTSDIEVVFGKENILVLLIPEKNAGKEARLCEDLSEIPHITSVTSLITTVGKTAGANPEAAFGASAGANAGTASGSTMKENAGTALGTAAAEQMPLELLLEFVPKETINQFYSDNYARIILNTDTAEEGKDAFNTVEAVLDTSAKYFDTYYLAGQSAALYDMKNIVTADTKLVNLIAAIGIFMVLLLTFRSLSIPIILLFTIETAIWINLSVPYFTGRPLNYIGYLIISTVQLGATVDYAILFTNRYLDNRKTLGKKDAMRATIGSNLAAVLVSAAILASAGFTLAYTSGNPVISELGTLLGRGATLSFIMVTFVLPALLVLLDKAIRKTTLKVDMGS